MRLACLRRFKRLATYMHLAAATPSRPWPTKSTRPLGPLQQNAPRRSPCARPGSNQTVIQTTPQSDQIRSDLNCYIALGALIYRWPQWCGVWEPYRCCQCSPYPISVVPGLCIHSQLCSFAASREWARKLHCAASLTALQAVLRSFHSQLRSRL